MHVRYSQRITKIKDYRAIEIIDHEKDVKHKFTTNMSQDELWDALKEFLLDLNSMYDELIFLKHHHNDKLYQSLCDIRNIVDEYKEYELNTSFKIMDDNYTGD